MQRTQRALTCALVVATFALTTVATAVPPARYQALGGASIAFTNDGFATRFNPAGLGRVGKGSFDLSVSPIFGGINAPIISKATVLRPNVADRQLDSEPIFGPGFMLGGSVRATPWLTFGLAIYPVSAGGADYRYIEDPEKEGATPITDFTKKLHAEVAPAITFTIPKNLIGGQYLSLGVAYRISYGSLTRQKGDPADPQTVNVTPTGFDFGGFTVGLQYQPISQLEIGIVYRHGIKIALQGDTGVFNPGLAKPVEGPVEGEIIAPGMIGAGIRLNLKPVSVVLDFEYEFNSQADLSPLTITDPVGYPFPTNSTVNGTEYNFEKGVLPLFATYLWDDSINIKSGVEWQVNEKLAAMIGYAWIGRSGNKKYPTPFGAPPAVSHVGSLGASYTTGAWKMNLAYNFRYANVTLEEEDIEGQEACNICTEAGEYTLMLHGIYFDFSYNWK